MSDSGGWGCFGKGMACGCVGCLLLVLALVGVALLGGGAALFGLSGGGPRDEALARARAEPELVAALGEPITAGLLTSGSIQLDNASGSADLSIPLSGPKGSATLYLVATKDAGQWHYTTLAVELADGGRRIDLAPATAALPPVEAAPPPGPVEAPPGS